MARPEILRQVGRHLIETFFEHFRADLARRDICLPGPDLGDDCYFHRLAALLGSGTPLPPLLQKTLVLMEKLAMPGDRRLALQSGTEGKLKLSRPAAAQLIAIRLGLAANPCFLPEAPFKAQYALRLGLGCWRLTFDGQEADLKHEQGIYYVAWLLQHPPRIPIHALDLEARIPSLVLKQSGISEIFDPASGQPVLLERHARLQERNLSLDYDQKPPLIRRRQKELLSTLDNAKAGQLARAEAQLELEQIAEFQRLYGEHDSDCAHRAAAAVGRSIRRFHARLLRGVDAKGNPHPVLRAFAAHLDRYLLIPSYRYANRGARRSRAGLAGCFTYEPPPGVIWSG